MTPAEVERCLTDYVDAVNTHDVTRMLADRHPESTLSLMGTSVTIQSRDSLDTFYRQFFTAAPGYRLTIENGLYADDLGVVWGSVTNAGDSTTDATTDTTDTSDAVPVVFVCSFEDDHFRHDRMYADFTRLSTGFGLSP
ncbi:nuclear transport factor 2 family protein [Actinomadura barringtoniae]|uniref:Nuclear transport factor 2 family protein n=1 Tax=Actinomadura barringtoniae TaxID=1427535 RepID=A0A939PN80_9ACTN|nr:nuclear transport factor 2 family protein [Actinomadura barringtoniae]MBO2453168.1 nuclear transport factor 2 family protein [Actinomadura barringtoniae]